MSLESIVRQTIAEYHMLEPGDNVLVGVSGGADSMALLSLLAGLASQYRLELSVFHLDHKIRQESGADAEFVRHAASALQLPFYLEQFDVPAFMKEEKLSLEEAARIARYRLMEQVRGATGANRIAVGHNADDQIETLLINLIRGAGLDGLRAMLPVRGMIIRPLIEVKRFDIMQYVEQLHIDYRHDASNDDISLLRNRIRLQLLPELRRYNPQISAVLLRTTELARDDFEYLESQTEQLFNTLAEANADKISLPLSEVQAQPAALRRRLVRRAVKHIKAGLAGLTFKHIELIDGYICAGVHSKVDLPDGLTVSIGADRVTVGQRMATRSLIIEPRELVIPGITELPELSVALEARYVERNDVDYTDRYTVFLDASKLDLPLEVRNRRPGDSFKPFGLHGTKKLQDFLVDEKVPQAERDLVPIVISGNNIVWVAGFRIDDEYRIKPATKRILRLHLIREQ